jgi:hypothetical protein
MLPLLRTSINEAAGTRRLWIVYFSIIDALSAQSSLFVNYFSTLGAKDYAKGNRKLYALWIKLYNVGPLV